MGDVTITDGEDAALEARLQNFVILLQQGKNPDIIDMVLRGLTEKHPEWKAKVYELSGVPDPKAQQKDVSVASAARKKSATSTKEKSKVGRSAKLSDSGSDSTDKADPSAHQAGAPSQLDSKKKNALFSESSDESKTGALPLSHAASAPQKANVLDESSSDPFEDIKRKQAAAPDVTAAVVAKPIPVPEAVVIKTPKSGRRAKDKEKIRKHESAGRKRTDTQVDTDVQEEDRRRERKKRKKKMKKKERESRIAPSGSFKSSRNASSRNASSYDFLSPELVTRPKDLTSDENTFDGEPLWVLYALTLTHIADYCLVLPALYSLISASSQKLWVYGLVFGAFPLGQLLFTPLAGMLAQERPLKTILLVCSLCTVVGYGTLLLLESDPVVLVCGRMLAGAGASHAGIARVSIMRLSSRGERTRRRLNALQWVQHLGLAMAPFFGLAFSQLDAVAVHFLAPVSDPAFKLTAHNLGVMVVWLFSLLLLLAQSIHFCRSPNRAPIYYSYLDPVEDMHGSNAVAAPGGFRAVSLGILHSACTLGFWAFVAAVIPLAKKNLSWGYDRCYCLFALMGGGALLAPLLLSALTSGSPVTTLAVTSPAAANPSAHFRLWNLSAVLSLAGTLLLFDLLGEETREEQLYLSAFLLAAGWAASRLVSASLCASLLQLPLVQMSTRPSLFMFFDGVARIAGPVLGAVLVEMEGDSLLDGTRSIRLLLAAILLVAFACKALCPFSPSDISSGYIQMGDSFPSSKSFGGRSNSSARDRRERRKQEYGSMERVAGSPHKERGLGHKLSHT